MTTTAEDITREALQAGGEEIPAQMRPCQIDITNEDQAVLAISKAVNYDIPGLYVRGGDVVQVCEVDSGNGPRLVIPTVDADGLRMLLARHTYCYRSKTVRGPDGDKVTVKTSGLPSVATTRAVLTQCDWPGLRPLAGVVSVPVVRSDGTIMTTRGYDAHTRLYYRPAFHVPDVPERPTAVQVQMAKEFVIGYVLGDFLFDSEASKANYLALLFTPLLRLFIGGLPPFGVISATTRGSGKTLLTEIMRAVYGVHMTPWVRKEEEFKKTVTSILRDTTAPVVCFDNVDSFDTISHGALSMLLTSTEWSERVLGVSNMFTGINDRLWVATGNNVSVGGDIASRSVLTRLDPQMERPEERTGFKISDLWAWLADDRNRANLMFYMLVLVRAWIADGATRDTTIKMRNFSAWAQAMGGLLAYHGIPEFLANRDELASGADDEETSTAAFLLKWFEKYGSAPQRATQLVDSARGDHFGGHWVDPWDGTFPSTYKDGRSIPFSAKGLGKFLAARRDRIFAGLVLRGDLDKKTKVWSYRVVPHETQDQP